jgi:hypothetical protein
MDDAHRAKVRAAEHLHERARQIRGRFLNVVAVVERDIALLLTEYFCREDPSKQTLFFNRIATSMSLNAKRLVLSEILKKDYPRYCENNGQPLADLQQIQEFRNKLAHSVVDVSDSALARPAEEGVGFVQWNEGEPITEGEFNEWEVRANGVLTTLSDIKRLLPYKEKGGA